jgi:hypothetical protein
MAVPYTVSKYLKAAAIKGASVHTLSHTMGRPFGRLVNISLDMTRHQRRVSSPWRSSVPSHSGLVSFQGTRASREGEADPQKANVQDGWEGLAGDWRRRDMTKPGLAYAA